MHTNKTNKKTKTAKQQKKTTSNWENQVKTQNKTKKN